MSPRDIWVPDMMISNSLSHFEIFASGSDLPLIVGYDGFRFWSVPVIINTKCTADVTFFPFDLQFCKIKLNSWTYHEKIMKLQMSGFETGMEDHVGNIEWSIVHVKGYLLNEPEITNHPLYINDSIIYTYIEYRMALKRKPDFYVNTLVVPSLLLSWLGTVIFMLPSECGEKLSFSITLFLALYINQVIVSEFLPPSADTYPLIAKFYMLISVILGGSIFSTAVILMFHFRLNPAVPEKDSFFYRIFSILERLGSVSFMGLHRKPDKKEVFRIDGATINHDAMQSLTSNRFNSSVIPFNVINNVSSSGSRHVHQKLIPSESFQEEIEPKLTPTDKSIISSSTNTPIATINGVPLTSSTENERNGRVLACSPQIESYLTRILDKLAIVAKDDTAEVSLKRWRVLASGLDRVFFVTYLLVMGVTTVYFFLLVLQVEKEKLDLDFDELLDNMH